MHSVFTLEVLDKLGEESREEQERAGRMSLVPLIPGTISLIRRKCVALVSKASGAIWQSRDPCKFFLFKIL